MVLVAELTIHPLINAIVKSEKMTSTFLAFGWSVLFVAMSAAKPAVHTASQLAQKNKHTASLTEDGKQDKTSFVIYGDYYAGPNREMETLLRAIQAQLSEMQQQLLDMKPVTKNETGEGGRNVQKSNFVPLKHSVNRLNQVEVNQVLG